MQIIPNKHGVGLVRDYNQKMLYNLIRMNNGISRADLTRMTNMSPTSTGKIIGILIDKGLIMEVGTTEESKIGRKAVKLSVVANGKLAIGVNVDIHQIEAGIVNVNGNVLYDVKCSNTSHATKSEVISKISILIQGLLEQLSSEKIEKVVGIGIGIPGVVFWKQGIIAFSPQFGWEDFHILDELKKKFPYDIYVENNVKAAAMAECLLGVAKNYNNFAIIQFGSGMGSALVSGGKLYRGENNMTGEIGHIIIESNGLQCECGRKGCLQTYTCIMGIEKQSGKSFYDTLEAAKAGDEKSQQILNNAIDYSSMWIANLANLYNPSLVMLYGEMLEAWPQMVNQIIQKHKQFLWSPFKQPLFIKTSELLKGDYAVVAASSIVFSQYFMSDVEIQSDSL